MTDLARILQLAGFKLDEVAPPGKKAERFIKKHKKEFKKRYGKRGSDVLYATAWKKFGEDITLRDYLRLVEKTA
jgi:hypothetical protein